MGRRREPGSAPRPVRAVRAAVVGVLVALTVGCAAFLDAPAAATDAPSIARSDARSTAPSDEEALADKFAPVVRLVRQDAACGPGEPYKPTDVDAVLDNDEVALRGPWQHDDLILVGPTGEDLGKGLDGYHLDFPGNPLEPDCGYETWARRITAGTPPTVYAHVGSEAAHADRLALQYWLYYPFNDYNNKHESDWELVQLIFPARDAREALDREPLEVGYSQHEGLETAGWGDEKLEILGGTHPVVHVAAGSHANYFDSALYLGRSSEQGFGCDDTRAPGGDVQPTVAVIPSDAAAARADFPWLAFRGHWGQREEAFYNGPTGPATKTKWTAPITFEEQSGRDESFAVPAGGLFGTQATDFFCGGVAGGSDVVRVLTDNPVPLLVFVLLAVLLVGFLVSRTTWRPTAPLHLARRRHAGQILAASARVYARHLFLFVGIGLPLVPVALLVAAVQTVAVGAPEIAGISRGGEEGGFRVAAAAVVGSLALGAAVVLVLAATVRALAELDAGREVGVREAYALSLRHRRALVGAFLISAGVLGVLSLTVLLTPVAAVLVVSFALFVPVAELEGRRAGESLRRSAALVRHRVVRVAVLLAIAIVLASAVGPLLGTLLILTTDAPFPFVNVVAGVTFAFLMPYVALTMAYVYFDARVTAELAVRPDDVLPAEGATAAGDALAGG